MSTQPILRHATRQSSHISRQIHSTSPQNPQSSQTFQLPDGRTLGYAEYGNPNGKPLLYFHGYPSSRLEGAAMDETARRCGIRLLALDRPGFGISTPQPGRKILDWPKDVNAFAKGVGLERFTIMGCSGGGPFALACAHVLPKDMLAGVGLFASGPPWVAGAHHMSLIRRLACVMAVYWPSGLGALLSLCVRGLRAIATSGPIVRRIDAWLKSEDEKKKKETGTLEDQKSMGKTPEERREYLLRLILDEPFAQGSDAAVLEAGLLSAQDWGFKFEEVDFDPIRIWHGVKDGNSPIVMMRYLAQRVPHSVLREYENDTHYTMAAHFEEALSKLAQDYDSKRS